MLGNRKPRERYKDQYKPHPGGTDTIHVMDAYVPVTPLLALNPAPIMTEGTL